MSRRAISVAAPGIAVGAHVSWPSRFGPSWRGVVLEALPRAQFVVRFSDGSIATVRRASLVPIAVRVAV
jgi:hypothetical protein